MIRPMAERRRGKNGAAKRYKGPRELVATRVHPDIVLNIDEATVAATTTRNDWLYAAVLVALDHPDEVVAALRRVAPSAPQLAFDGTEEVLDQSA